MIKPLRDNIVAIPVEPTDKVGVLVMPENFKQALRVHYRALVLFSGPKAVDCPSGSIIHVSESWGERFTYRGKQVWIGRARDINGVCVGESIADTGKYMD